MYILNVSKINRFLSPLLRGLLALVFVINFAGSVRGSALSERESLELAFSKKVLSHPTADQPTINSDGRYVAYTIFERVALPETTGDVQPRIYSNGTPQPVIGLRLFISGIHNRELISVCEENTNCWRPSWSPDGRQLAYYSDVAGFPQAYIYDLATSKSKRVNIVKIKARLWPADAPIWSLDGRELIVPVNLSKEQGGRKETQNEASLVKSKVNVYKTSSDTSTTSAEAIPDAASEEMQILESNATLAALDLQTGDMRIIVPAETQPRPSAAMRLSPDGKWLSYLSLAKGKGGVSSEWSEDLLVVSAKGGMPSVMASELAHTFASYLGDALYRWIPDSSGVIFLKDKKLWSYDLVSKTPRQLGTNLGELTDDFFFLTADGKMAIVGLATKPIALISLDGSEEKILPFHGVPIRMHRDRLWQSDGDSFFLLTSKDSSLQNSILKINYRNESSSQMWKGRGKFEFVGSMTKDQLVAVYEDFESPRDLYLFDSRFSRHKRITQVEPRLERGGIGSVATFTTTIPSFNGKLTQVQTSIVLPETFKKGKPAPTIVNFYPGSSHVDFASRFAGGDPSSIPTQPFTSRGYAVLLVDVPLSAMDSSGNPIQEITDAVLPQVYRAVDLGYVDVNRIAIMGQSYGGYGTAAIISQTNLFRAAIAMAGLYDLPGFYANEPYNRRWCETGQGRMGTHPWNDLGRYAANSPYYQAHKINTPLLLIHGAKDEIPAGEAKKLFNALDRLGKTAELALYEGEGHVPGDWSVTNAVDVVLRMLDFLSKHFTKRS